VITTVNLFDQMPTSRTAAPIFFFSHLFDVSQSETVGTFKHSFIVNMGSTKLSASCTCLKSAFGTKNHRLIPLEIHWRRIANESRTAIFAGAVKWKECTKLFLYRVVTDHVIVIKVALNYCDVDGLWTATSGRITCSIGKARSEMSVETFDTIDASTIEIDKLLRVEVGEANFARACVFGA
jgi:hypothetical protein